MGGRVRGPHSGGAIAWVGNSPLPTTEVWNCPDDLPSRTPSPPLRRGRFPLPVWEYLSLSEVGRMALVSRRLREASTGAIQSLRTLSIGSEEYRGDLDLHSNSLEYWVSFKRSQRHVGGFEYPV